MSVFTKGFQGREDLLEFMSKTIDKLGYNIQGVVCDNSQLMSTDDDKEVYFYTKPAKPTLTAGDPMSFFACGVRRVDIPMTGRIALAHIISTTSDTLTCKYNIIGVIIDETIKSLEIYNKKMINAIDSAAQVQYSDKKENAELMLIVAVKKFTEDTGTAPTAVLASPDIFIELVTGVKANINVRLNKVMGRKTLTTPTISCPIVECDAIEDSNIDFYVVNAKEIKAPIVAHSLVVTDATPAGYKNGTLIAGELLFGFNITDKVAAVKYISVK